MKNYSPSGMFIYNSIYTGNSRSRKRSAHRSITLLVCERKQNHLNRGNRDFNGLKKKNGIREPQAVGHGDLLGLSKLGYQGNSEV